MRTMDLEAYLQTVIRKDFAKKLGISVRALANYADGIRLTPLNVAHLIEQITHRKVRTEDLQRTWENRRKYG